MTQDELVALEIVMGSTGNFVLIMTQLRIWAWKQVAPEAKPKTNSLGLAEGDSRSANFAWAMANGSGNSLIHVVALAAVVIAAVLARIVVVL